MDQFVSCMGRAGHAFLLDCRSLEFKFVPIPPGIRLVVCNTMVKHDVATSAYNTRRAECEEGVRLFAQWDSSVHALRDVSVDLLEQHSRDLPPTIWKRCSHVVRENQRTEDAASALSSGDLKHLGQLMRESHHSLRDLYEKRPVANSTSWSRPPKACRLLRRTHDRRRFRRLHGQSRKRRERHRLRRTNLRTVPTINRNHSPGVHLLRRGRRDITRAYVPGIS